MEHGFGVVAWQANEYYTWHLVWVPVCVPAAPLPIQLHSDGLGKQQGGPKDFGPLNPCGRLQTGPALVMTTIWGASQQMDLSPFSVILILK